MDNLTYTYTLSSAASANQLGKVTDASAITNGFSDVNTSGVDDYVYDSSGNVTSDLNKAISAITYNVLGKASQITFSNGNVITYSYDASGTKLRMATTKSSLTTTTDYVKGFVYRNDTLNFFSAPEGRIVNNGTSLEYQYAIADHQGNTRVVFSSVAPAVETLTVGWENGFPDCWEYGGDLTGSPVHSGAWAAELLGAPGYQIAVPKSYHVYAGDKVELSGYAYSDGVRCCTSDLSAFTTLLLTTFGLTAPAPGETHTARAALAAEGSLMATGYGDGSTDNTDARVFFNILVFDKNYNLIHTVYKQVQDNSAWDFIDLKYTATEEAFVYTYISNENPEWREIWIDDVTTTHTPSNVVQYNEYYPFGLQTAKSWTRPQKTDNQFLYDAGSELNATTGMYDLPYRNYDPALGRFFQVDPISIIEHKLSPYQYSRNNTIRLNDPSGALVPMPDEVGRSTQGILGNYQDGWTGWSLDFGQSGIFGGGGGMYTGGKGSMSGIYTSSDGSVYMMSYGNVFIFNQWQAESGEDPYVSADEILGYDATNMRQSYRDKARDAISSANAYSFNLVDYNNPKFGALLNLDWNTVGRNRYGDHYTGKNNPLSKDGSPNYILQPKNVRDFLSMMHDQDYDRKKATGAVDLLFNSNLIDEDLAFAKNQIKWGAMQMWSGSMIEGYDGIEAGLFVGAAGIFKKGLGPNLNSDNKIY